MDIHKPKPWHGLREFLKEYVIIVIGVLTALGAEQAVEWLHWKEKVAQTEEVLLPEAQFNLLSSYDRIIVAPCQARRIGELRDALLKPGPDWKGMPVSTGVVAADPTKADLATWARSTAAAGASAMPGFYFRPSRPWREGVWSLAVANGVFDHMARHRAAAYARMYRGFEQMREQQQREDAALGRIQALAFDRKLTEAEKTEFLSAVATLNSVNLTMATYGAQMIVDGDKYGLRIKASEAKASLDRVSKGPRADCFVPLKIPLAPG